VSKAKPFSISKHEVYAAYKQDKANKGAAGVDRQTIADFESKLEDNLYKLWNRLSSGSYFHPDSYGYRPGKSAVEAVGVARERCWRYDWVLDLDISTFFDSIDHELMVKALRFHTDSKWVLLYVERWLKAPFKLPNGSLEERHQGTPQGGVISPLLANLFLHYAFDRWMQKNYPKVPFERYATVIIKSTAD